MHPDTTIRRRGAMMEALVDGDLVALHEDQGTCYGFNATATRVWTLLEQPRTFSELADALTSEFEVGREDCERQLAELLDQLSAEDLVEIG